MPLFVATTGILGTLGTLGTVGTVGGELYHVVHAAQVVTQELTIAERLLVLRLLTQQGS